MKYIFLLIPTLLILGCSDNTETFGGKFDSIKTCLERTQTHSNSKISFIAKDEPTIVTGKLANGAFFGCKLVSTGTEGSYIEGWYTITKK